MKTGCRRLLWKQRKEEFNRKCRRRGKGVYVIVEKVGGTKNGLVGNTGEALGTVARNRNTLVERKDRIHYTGQKMRSREGVKISSKRRRSFARLTQQMNICSVGKSCR